MREKLVGGALAWALFGLIVAAAPEAARAQGLGPAGDRNGGVPPRPEA
ncbi:MAG: hypothetical protein HYW06_05840 [Gemmatimonadetes bacterium]|nr:hypothetical protein [Gemmatimonadota bacterium]